MKANTLLGYKVQRINRAKSGKD